MYGKDDQKNIKLSLYLIGMGGKRREIHETLRTATLPIDRRFNQATELTSQFELPPYEMSDNG